MVQIITSTEIAANELRQGNVLSIPTETVYGLAADAENNNAINKVFNIKNRPTDHPLIIHVYDIEMAKKYCQDIPDYASKLIAQFWPGPLTLVLNKSPLTSKMVTGGQNTVAIRSPSHLVCRELLKKFNSGLVAPSANKYCHISTTSSKHVLDEFDNEFNYVLEGGDCTVGIESTIIDATNNQYFKILRPGVITAAELEKACGIKCINNTDSNIKVSGDKKSHYAPNNPVFILNTAQINSIDPNKNFLLICNNLNIAKYQLSSKNIAEYKNISDLSNHLYSWLRIGENNFDFTVIEEPPRTPEWNAIWDRISKACFNYTNQVDTLLNNGI